MIKMSEKLETVEKPKTAEKPKMAEKQKLSQNLTRILSSDPVI